jgi:hypothetical protein
MNSDLAVLKLYKSTENTSNLFEKIIPNKFSADVTQGRIILK